MWPQTNNPLDPDLQPRNPTGRSIYHVLSSPHEGYKPSVASPEDLILQNQFNLAGNSQLEKWGALARNQALGAGYSGAAAAQAEMRAKNRGWLSLAEQADEWTRRMTELALQKKAQAAGINTTTPETSYLTGFFGGLGL